MWQVSFGWVVELPLVVLWISQGPKTVGSLWCITRGKKTKQMLLSLALAILSHPRFWHIWPCDESFNPMCLKLNAYDCVCDMSANNILQIFFYRSGLFKWPEWSTMGGFDLVKVSVANRLPLTTFVSSGVWLVWLFLKGPKLFSPGL